MRTATHNGLAYMPEVLNWELSAELLIIYFSSIETRDRVCRGHTLSFAEEKLSGSLLLSLSLIYIRLA